MDVLDYYRRRRDTLALGEPVVPAAILQLARDSQAADRALAVALGLDAACVDALPAPAVEFRRGRSAPGKATPHQARVILAIPAEGNLTLEQIARVHHAHVLPHHVDEARQLTHRMQDRGFVVAFFDSTLGPERRYRLTAAGRVERDRLSNTPPSDGRRRHARMS